MPALTIGGLRKAFIDLVILLVAIGAGGDALARDKNSDTSKSKPIDDPVIVKTPAPSGPVPMPYPNLGRRKSTSKKPPQQRDR